MKFYFAFFCILATQAFSENAVVDCKPSSVTNLRGSEIDTDSEFVQMNANREYRLVSPSENTVGVIFNYDQPNEIISYFNSLGSKNLVSLDYVIQDEAMKDIYLQIDRGLFSRGGKATMVATGTTEVTIWFLDCEL